jgi:hypothetical protein
MSLIDLTFSLRKWEDTQSQITRMRKQVFMDEYNLPLNFLRHKDDAERYHVVAYDDLTGRPIGTGCIHSDGHIGRMAILHSQYKATSVAHVIVDYLMHISHALKQDRVWLNAPIDTLDYFAYRDFYPMGDTFEYCGVTMQKVELWQEAEQHNKILVRQQVNERPTNVLPLH